MKPGLKKVILPAVGGPIPVLVMEEKGEGKFPIETAIAEARQRLEQAQQQ